MEDAVLARVVRAGVLEEVAFEQRSEMKGLSRSWCLSVPGVF